MVVKKAGTILLNLDTKQISLVYREEDNGYTLPKGHLESGETLEECAIRETEEETLIKSHLFSDKPAGIIRYQNKEDGDVEVYYYIAIADKKTDKNIPEKYREIHEWVNLEEVENKLTYENLIEFWNKIKEQIREILENN